MEVVSHILLQSPPTKIIEVSEFLDNLYKNEVMPSKPSDRSNFLRNVAITMGKFISTPRFSQMTAIDGKGKTGVVCNILRVSKLSDIGILYFEATYTLSHIPNLLDLQETGNDK